MTSTTNDSVGSVNAKSHPELRLAPFTCRCRNQVAAASAQWTARTNAASLRPWSCESTYSPWRQAKPVGVESQDRCRLDRANGGTFRPAVKEVRPAEELTGTDRQNARWPASRGWEFDRHEPTFYDIEMRIDLACAVYYSHGSLVFRAIPHKAIEITGIHLSEKGVFEPRPDGRCHPREPLAQLVEITSFHDPALFNIALVPRINQEIPLGEASERDEVSSEQHQYVIFRAAFECSIRTSLTILSANALISIGWLRWQRFSVLRFPDGAAVRAWRCPFCGHPRE